MLIMEIDNLVDVIKRSMDSFKKNELAYLSMTSKNELPIRDRIAYELYSNYNNYIVAREYSPKGINSRIDLAILKNNNIKDIIELKSMYTFDSVNMQNFINSINNDFNKNSELLSDVINQYEIIIATHVKTIPNEEFSKYIKYYRLIKKYTLKDSKELIKNLDCIIKKEFPEKQYEIRSFIINAGEAFEVDVDVCFWILKNKKY